MIKCFIIRATPLLSCVLEKWKSRDWYSIIRGDINFSFKINILCTHTPHQKSVSVEMKIVREKESGWCKSMGKPETNGTSLHRQPHNPLQLSGCTPGGFELQSKEAEAMLYHRGCLPSSSVQQSRCYLNLRILLQAGFAQQFKWKKKTHLEEESGSSARTQSLSSVVKNTAVAHPEPPFTCLHLLCLHGWREWEAIKRKDFSSKKRAKKPGF